MTRTDRSITLVTGGAGFIGAELVAQLIAAGRAVRVLDDLSTGEPANLEEPLASGRCELVIGDVRDPRAVRACLDGVDTVFHLACVGLRRSLSEPLLCHEVNATGTLVTLEQCRHAGVRRLVHVSSSEVYGTARDDRPMDEDHPLRPTTPYGAAKLAGEAYARSAFLSFGLPVVLIRPFNAYGPRSHSEGDAGEVIPRFITRALAGQPLRIQGDGRQSRDFTHVRDIARGLVMAEASAAAVGATINLGSGVGIEIGRLAEMIRDLCGSGDPPIEHSPTRPGDVRRLLADAGLARRLLDWTPTVSWEQGLRDVITWFAAQVSAATSEQPLLLGGKTCKAHSDR